MKGGTLFRGACLKEIVLNVDFQGTVVTPLRCSPDSTITQIKTEIARMCGVPENEQILLVGITALSEDDYTVRSYGIDNTTRIVLFLNTFEDVKKKAFLENDPGALYNLGYLYEYGFKDGCITPDPGMALEIYERAACLNHGPACNYLSFCLREGKHTIKNEEKGLALLRRAAKLDNLSAMTTLGHMYANGVGVEKDVQKAVSLFSAAAKKGNAISAYNLGVMHEIALGVELNIVKAIEYYAKAYILGNPADRITIAEGCHEIFDSIFNQKMDENFTREKCMNYLILIHKSIPYWTDLFNIGRTKKSLEKALETPRNIYEFIIDVCMERNANGETMLAILDSFDFDGIGLSVLRSIVDVCKNAHKRWSSAIMQVGLAYAFTDCPLAKLPPEIISHIVKMITLHSFGIWKDPTESDLDNSVKSTNYETVNVI